MTGLFLAISVLAPGLGLPWLAGAADVPLLHLGDDVQGQEMGKGQARGQVKEQEQEQEQEKGQGPGCGHHSWVKRDILVDMKTPEGETRQLYHPGHSLEMHCGAGVITCEVIPTKGGLLQAFKLDGDSVVLNKPWPHDLDGSIFWPSPQRDWVWPPPAQIDPVPSKLELAYSEQVNVTTGALVLTSPVVPNMGIQVRKSIAADPSAAAVELTYEILNVGDRSRSLAPWEITRVPPGGLSFFVNGEKAMSSGSWPQLDTRTHDSATWFQHRPSGKGTGKLYAEPGRGWLAHVSGDLILVKCFQRVPDEATAPDERQLEIYDGGDYVEIEVQGAYTPISPGQRLTWQVRWYLRRVPQAERVGGALVTLADGLCGSGTAQISTESSLLQGTPVRKFDRLLGMNGMRAVELDNVEEVLETSRTLKCFFKRPKSYAFKIRKRTEESLGISLGYAAHDEFLVIQDISANGVINQLNEEYHDRQVCRYDAIISVNGVVGIAKELVSVIEEADVLTFGMLRWHNKGELVDRGLDFR